jgi:RNA polymerase-binding transcription factor DksA
MCQPWALLSARVAVLRIPGREFIKLSESPRRGLEPSWVLRLGRPAVRSFMEKRIGASGRAAGAPQRRTTVAPKRKASSADVLAGGDTRPARPRKWAEHYKRLIDLRGHLTKERHTLKRDAGEESPQFSLHIADAATDSYDRDFALGMLSSEQDALYEIEEALDRIRTGSYGICEMTGQPIAKARLTAIPWTRFSADAERQLEKRGQVGHARLGRRETLPPSRKTKEHE